MNYINPKIDFAFKKIFGDEQHKNILISFLNAILYNAEAIIQDLDILNPYNAPKLSGLKDTFLDVKARVTGGKFVIIEMQVASTGGFAKRVLYNVAKKYSMQLKAGEGYSTLSPVIGLTIMDFALFDDQKVKSFLSRYGLYDYTNEIAYPVEDIELVFVELPKFKKSLAEAQTITDKWLYFIRYASTLEEIPVSMKNEPAIEQAFKIAEATNLTPEELDELEQRQFHAFDMQELTESQAMMKKQIEEMKQQFKEVEQQAKEAEQQAKEAEQQAKEAEQQAKEAEQQAKEAEEYGRTERSIEIARQLLDILDDNMISRKTNLSVQQVQKLRQESDNV